MTLGHAINKFEKKGCPLFSEQPLFLKIFQII